MSFQHLTIIYFFWFICNILSRILIPKNIISMPLMIENPVRRPSVPPIAESISTNLAALSFVIRSKEGVSKYILTNLNLFFHSNPVWKFNFTSICILQAYYLSMLEGMLSRFCILCKTEMFLESNVQSLWIPRFWNSQWAKVQNKVANIDDLQWWYFWHILGLLIHRLSRF